MQHQDGPLLLEFYGIIVQNRSKIVTPKFLALLDTNMTMPRNSEAPGAAPGVDLFSWSFMLTSFRIVTPDFLALLNIYYMTTPRFSEVPGDLDGPLLLEFSVIFLYNQSEIDGFDSAKHIYDSTEVPVEEAHPDHQVPRRTSASSYSCLALSKIPE